MRIQVQSAAVDIKRLAQQLAAHRRTLNVPARPSLPPGAVPRRFVRLGLLPKREIARRPFAGGGAAAFALLDSPEPVVAEFDEAVGDIVDEFGVADRISYISTGGGAFLEFVEGKKLPAVEVLERRAANS